jgi:hypothetical protein
MEKVASISVNRRAALGMAMCVGVGFGLYNTYWPTVDVSITPGLVVWLVLSIPLTAVCHELVHGLTARVFGYRPQYGFKPPMVYITFSELVTALHYKLIALAPFVILSGACIALLVHDALSQLAYLCLMVNVMGSVADLWAVARLLFRNRGYVVRDTKAGFDLYRLM